MHWSSLASGCLLLECTENCEVINEIFRWHLDLKGLNLRDSQNGCAVSAPIAAWSCIA